MGVDLLRGEGEKEFNLGMAAGMGVAPSRGRFFNRGHNARRNPLPVRELQKARVRVASGCSREYTGE